MQDWVKYTDQFLTFSERTVLNGSGTVSRAMAEAHAAGEYAKFEAARREAERIEADNEHLREIEQATRQAIKERPKD